MRVAIIGGGISGLSAAYYLRKFSLPISEILLFESSNRFGGWIDSRRYQFNNEQIVYEKGPRTLRLATGELKELNALQLADELELNNSMQIISRDHLAAKNRYVYFDGKIRPIELIEAVLFLYMTTEIVTNMGTFTGCKTDLLSKGMMRYGVNELITSRRPKSLEDESIWSFIERRFDAQIADNMVDPIFKGIVAGDVKNLSAASLLKAFWEYEEKYRSIAGGMIVNTMIKQPENDFPDLLALRGRAKNQSIWRLKNGMEEMVEKLVKKLSNDGKVRLYLNEPVQRIEFDDENTKESVRIKSKIHDEKVDIVISSIYSKYKHFKLKSFLAKIESVDVALINFYFKEDVLPVKGFGYLVPSNQNSPILGCIFDSVFNEASQKSTVITVMMGGAWFDKYIGNKDEAGIYDLAFKEIKKHLNLNAEPDHFHLSVLKNAIPQYKVGHQKLLKNIKENLVEDRIDDRFYLAGYSYEGVGVNDCLFNTRKLVQNVLSKNKRFF